MKTQILNNRTITVIVALLFVAFTATEVAAQRREQNNSRENVTKAMEQVKKNTPKEHDSNKAVTPRNNQDKRERPNGSGNRENDRADNSWKNNHNGDKQYDNRNNHKGKDHRNNDWDRSYHRNWNHKHAPDFHVNLDLRPHHNYNWHRHNHISFKHLPRRAVWVLIDGENYAYYKGRFYLPGPFGFFRVTPPDYLRALPNGCFKVLIDNQPMWSLNGIFFLETPFGFKIIV